MHELEYFHFEAAAGNTTKSLTLWESVQYLLNKSIYRTILKETIKI